MREILFRGKRTDTGEWVEGFYIPLKDGGNPIEHYIYGKAKVIPETVGQYVGKDKNGNRIFEGDIVEEKCGAFTHRYTVIYDRGLYFPFADDLCCDEVVVLGNIHDNPELLEGNK